jgi:hypothetical protein
MATSASGTCSTPVLLRILGDLPGQRILDAGCGNGYLSRMLAGEPDGVQGLLDGHSWVAHSMVNRRGAELAWSTGSEWGHNPSRAEVLRDQGESHRCNRLLMRLGGGPRGFGEGVPTGGTVAGWQT